MGLFAGDFWFTATPAQVGPSKQIFERFQGMTIYRCEDGFYWQEGGYHETVGECRDEIDDWNNSHREQREDSPSLDAPWWESR